LFWKSKNRVAQRIGAPAPNASLETAISLLEQKGIWTAAKLDVFQDSLLVTNNPQMGVMDSETGELWSDHKGLHWANPYDTRVWDYTISLCLELIALGVDEIQFDYVRFPSDGNMSTIEYPVVMKGVTMAECIGKFLSYAHDELEPSGILISVDLFGMTAWKTEDFGVGQVLEQIAPHVDVICPMFYPSHFPENFLNLENPGHYPYEIMKSSLKEMKKRTGKDIRPWIQGFWYKPEEIEAQLRGIFDNEIHDWTVWNPAGRYGETFEALAGRAGLTLPEPEFYSPLEELRNRDDRVMLGATKVINHTAFKEGYSILSLDGSGNGDKNEYATLIDVFSTLDEGLLDRILDERGFTFSHWTSCGTKIAQVTQLAIQDLSVDPYRMRPVPIYIDWENECVFSFSVPAERLGDYLSHIENMIVPKLKTQ